MQKNEKHNAHTKKKKSSSNMFSNLQANLGSELG